MSGDRREPIEILAAALADGRDPAEEIPAALSCLDALARESYRIVPAGVDVTSIVQVVADTDPPKANARLYAGWVLLAASIDANGFPTFVLGLPREEAENDYGTCPWYVREYRLPGYDPHGVCSFGCRDEPACTTSEPRGGWPSHPRDETGAFALAEDRQPTRTLPAPQLDGSDLDEAPVRLEQPDRPVI